MNHAPVRSQHGREAGYDSDGRHRQERRDVRVLRGVVYQAAVDLLRVFTLAVGTLVVSACVARAALGLDFFVAATLLNLAINSTWPAVAALTIAVRKLLTFSLSLVGRGGF